jgi:hypothetical protein
MYVIATPELMTSAATDLATIGSDLTEAHLAAVAPTVSLVPAAADEVSAAIASLLSEHAQDFQALAGRAAAFHEEFVQHLHAGASSYASTDAASASWLRSLNASAASSASTPLAWAEWAWAEINDIFGSSLFNSLPFPVQGYITDLFVIPYVILWILVGEPGG